jgi:purine-nucleoside phosphorylase
MEAATLFAMARRRDVEAGCVLLVSDALAGGHVRIDPDLLLERELHLGRLALAALTVGSRAT